MKFFLRETVCGQKLPGLLRAVAGVGMLGAMVCLPATSQIRASVSVDLAKPVNVLTEMSLSTPAATFDGNIFNPEGIPFLRAAGITAVRYPANHGVADLYHWSTKTTTRYKGVETPYIAPESNFGNFAQFAEKLGRAVIVVNYGANMDGDGGGEPAEAAAWVAYANGDAASTVAIGKDSTGEDWHTVGYWATLRGQAPLAVDDGLNFLRIQHPKPFNFRLWQIGDQLYNNGYFGGERVGNPDMHGPAPTAAKDWSHLKGNAKLGPAAIAENLVAFSKAMKAVDPAILVGVSFPTPPLNSDEKVTTPEWTNNILKGACASLDYANLEWNTGNPQPPDWKILDEAQLFANTPANLNAIIMGMRSSYEKSCPQGRILRLAFGTAGIQSWLKIEHPMVKPLWLADTYAMLIETGSANINWTEMYGDSMIAPDRKKLGGAFFGTQMLHVIAYMPGDRMLSANSQVPSTLNIHATHRRDGNIGLMLVNKDPHAAYKVKVTLKNGVVGTAGKRFDYGPDQLNAGVPMTVSPFTAEGNEFTVTVAPYTITDILLPDHK